MDIKSLERLELNKILSFCAEYAVTEGGKAEISALTPAESLQAARKRLALTAEADKLLYSLGIGKIEYFDDVSDLLVRAEKGSTLSLGELLSCAQLLRSAKIAYASINRYRQEAENVYEIAKNIYYDENLEDEIFTSIISDTELSDSASAKLYSLRQKIKNLNERIRGALAEYVSGKNSQFLQDAIVTVRNDRYVIPVKAEHKSKVRGFVHDRSKTGATYFIEPEYVLELNNELIALTYEEREEVEAILKSFSARVGSIAKMLDSDMSLLAKIDALFALAEYSYANKCVRPAVNNRGFVDIIKGRHPLINSKTVVPVSVSLGKDYNFLLLSGANTGGKTVTLKMCGLFCVMAACGLFVPAAQGTQLAIFKNVFCDIGDSQSIEESLSTFSSHLKTVIEICDLADKESFVLIDELGGGTNPDEGQALAKAVVEHLILKGAKGIVTTHFTALKEFAYSVGGIENAGMEFDADTLKPLYRVKIGLPGESRALSVSKRLGLDGRILERAYGFLSDGARSFENILNRAEESRIAADEAKARAEQVEREWRKKLEEVSAQTESLNREREKIARGARVETRRIVSERTARAEEILSEIENIFKRESFSESDLIRARTLKNKLEDAAYDDEEEIAKPDDYVKATAQNLTVGTKVYIERAGASGEVLSFSPQKDEAEILCGTIKMRVKLKDILVKPQKSDVKTGKKDKGEDKKVKVLRRFSPSTPQLEINVIGKNVEEALFEVENFIDKAVLDGLEEIKVIHGVGTGKLKNAIAETLRRHKRVESFRLGKYGEGETGVTFIKLK